MNSDLKLVKTSVEVQSEAELPKERKYTAAILACWKRIGFHDFSAPPNMYPWSGRSQHIARRMVFSKYIEPCDVLRAVWIEEQAKRTDSNWRAKEPGMSYISALMRERSGNRWMEEIDELAYRLPTVKDYMDIEWGETTRAYLAIERRRNIRLAQ